MAQVKRKDGVRGAAPVRAADQFSATTARQPVRAKPSSSPHDLPAHGHRLKRRPCRPSRAARDRLRRPWTPASALTDLAAYRNDGQDQELVDQHLTPALQTKGRAI